MAAVSPPEELEQIRRGAVEIITEPDLLAKLKQKPRLTIKAGFDPTAPDLHLGHTVLLRKLRQFQDLGHTVVFLIGDATALVGDPSGQSKLRKLMTPQEVEANATTYVQQVSGLLRVDDAKTFQLRKNSEWFGQSFGLKELVEVASKYTLARLIERDDFQKRMKAGQEISALEIFYPLMQGYDSVQLQADVEMGGTDQKWNLMVGRDLQRAYGQEPQVVLTMPLLEGTDGVQKMSKSLGNHIGIREPAKEMFGKLMSIPDTLIIKYFTLLTDVETARITAFERSLKEKTKNPRDIKAELARTITAQYHGQDAAQAASEEFSSVFSKRQAPSDIPEIRLPAGTKEIDLIEVIVNQGIAKTKNEAKRLLKQGAIKVNGVVVKQPSVPAQGSTMVQVGQRHFRKLIAH